MGTLAGALVNGEDPHADFDAGAKLGRYVVLQRMGAGGMGVVYAAYDPQLDRRIALKLMHQRGDDETQAERASRRMLAEAKAMAQLSHPNVITVHDVGTIDRRVFIAMEFVEGVPLSEWMRQPGRTWQQILEVFVKAGRGLEAAHAVNLIHRDFKPDNVLVGADGRVRVLDFGLARRIDGTREANERRDREAGTPAYMSPEQHLGSALDHRADQFSFCVALYEALYGEMPFAAKTRLELALAVTDGRVGPAPKRASVPNWLRWVLLRGLDPDPEGRHPDMASLLTALSRDPRRRWRNIAIASGVAVAALALTAATIVFVRGVQTPEPETDDTVECSASAAAELAEVWDPSRAEAVHGAFAELDAPWAAQLVKEVDAGLASWAGAWEAMHGEACEATRDGRQSDTMLDRRMLCLDGQRAEFGQLVEVLSSGEAESLRRAGEAVRQLPSLELCTAAVLERGAAAPERSAQVQATLAELERDLARARSLELTGAFEEAEQLAANAAHEAKELDEHELRARALFGQARVVVAVGMIDAGVELLEEGAYAAERAGADRLRGDILIELARLDCEAGDAPGASSHVREARAVLDRIDANVIEYATLDGVAARSLAVAGQLDEGEALVRGAIESLVGVEPPPIELAELHEVLGRILRERGLYAEARAELEAARELWARDYGEQHPTIAGVRFELAVVYHRDERHAKAIPHCEAAAEVFEQVFGGNSLEVARASAGLATCLGEVGRSDESLRQYQRARAVFRARGDASLAELARTLDGEGVLRNRLEQYEQAVSNHQQALALFEELGSGSSGVSDAELAGVLGHLARNLIALERAREARPHLDRALGLVEGLVEALGQPNLAELRFLAAQAWAAGADADPAQARALAETALEGFRAAGQELEAAEVQAWLETTL